jgi:hypothetical protein
MAVVIIGVTVSAQVAVHIRAGYHSARGMSSIPSDSAQQFAMTVLVPEVEDAQRLAAALDEVRRSDGPLAVIAVPPVRGVAFFADSDRQPKLDRWWAHAIPEDSVPVYLLIDEEGIVQWLPGLDGRFVVGFATPDDARPYAGLPNVTVAAGNSLLDVALAAVALFAAAPVFRDDAAARLDKRLRRPHAELNSRFRRARLRPADEAFLRGAGPAAGHPIPNLPPHDAVAELGEDAHREELVRALAETLRRLERIRSA